jgi:hypothetical protein
MIITVKNAENDTVLFQGNTGWEVTLYDCMFLQGACYTVIDTRDPSNIMVWPGHDMHSMWEIKFQ